MDFIENARKIFVGKYSQPYLACLRISILKMIG